MGQTITAAAAVSQLPSDIDALTATICRGSAPGRARNPERRVGPKGVGTNTD